MITKPRATVEDLYNVPENGKAEIVNGELILMSPIGAKPSRAGGRIYASLLDHEEEHGGGYAFPDNAGFIVHLPNRTSFSPDAAWYTGNSVEMTFLEGPLAVAVEVRSEGDYGPSAEQAIPDKIADYFAAGTKVVWVVDLLGDAIIKAFHVDNPEVPTVHRHGSIADAEPAVPGWRFPVERLLK